LASDTSTPFQTHLVRLLSRGQWKKVVKPKPKALLLQLKAGDVHGVLDREKAEIGALITLRDPTQPMRKEAADAGFYQPPWGQHPHMQLLTVEGLLNGTERLSCPPLRQVDATFKRAPRASQNAPDAASLFDSDDE
jgi:hypothetical protein